MNEVDKALEAHLRVWTVAPEDRALYGHAFRSGWDARTANTEVVMDDLELALIEIWRLRGAAEHVVECAQNLPRYGKVRGQAAREILDSVTKMKTPVLDDETKAELLTEIRARAAERRAS